MEQIKYNDQIIEFELTYSRRKNLEIRVENPDVVRVKAPLGVSKSQVYELVLSKAEWILAKLEILKQRTPPVEKRFIDGEEFVYLGQVYRLAVVIDEGVRKPVVKLNGGELVITAPIFDPELLRTFVQKWYGEQVLDLTSELVEEYVDVIGRRPAKIKISSARKRWGSCSSQGNVLLSWRLAMAPLPVLEYVLVHELCHLVHMNHSREYWDLVESVLPDYQERLGWLKANGAQLDI